MRSRLHSARYPQIPKTLTEGADQLRIGLREDGDHQDDQRQTRRLLRIAFDGGCESSDDDHGGEERSHRTTLSARSGVGASAPRRSASAVEVLGPIRRCVARSCFVYSYTRFITRLHANSHEACTKGFPGTASERRRAARLGRPTYAASRLRSGRDFPHHRAAPDDASLRSRVVLRGPMHDAAIVPQDQLTG